MLRRGLPYCPLICIGGLRLLCKTELSASRAIDIRVSQEVQRTYYHIQIMNFLVPSLLALLHSSRLHSYLVSSLLPVHPSLSP
jgi:hypothetical protein